MQQNFSTLNKHNIVDFIGDIFNRRGADSYLGEEVSMSEHMLQCALLAEQAHAGDELVCAALLHDIGHYTNEFEDDALARGVNNHHDTAGAAVLAAYFPKVVIDCVRYHVDAKRYLCATDPHYFGKLSAASVDTLKLQGGSMDEDEVREFELNPNLKPIIQVRIWDEGSKIKDLKTPSFEYYAPVLKRVVARF